MTDEADFFAPREEQRNLYQEGVCVPGWIEGMPLPAAEPLYAPAPTTEELERNELVKQIAAGLLRRMGG